MRVEIVRHEDSPGYGSRPVYRTDCGRFEITKSIGYSRDHAHRKIAWLCIRPLTPDAPLHDWRVMQQIKNLICGPQYEAIEIFPPEGELMDANNNFHLWVFLDTYKMPFGFRDGRLISDPRMNPPNVSTNTPQRPFEIIPGDAMDAIRVAQAIVNGKRPFLTGGQMNEIKRTEKKKEKRRKR